MQTETAAAVDQVEPALTERQKEIKSEAALTNNLTPSRGESFLVTVDRDELKDFVKGLGGFPFNIHTLRADGTTRHERMAKSVEIHGPSWMVPLTTTLRICGRDEPNILALETTSPITVRV